MWLFEGKLKVKMAHDYRPCLKNVRAKLPINSICNIVGKLRFLEFTRDLRKLALGSLSKRPFSRLVLRFQLQGTQIIPTDIIYSLGASFLPFH